MSETTGVPYPGPDAGEIDPWSKCVYDVLRDWALAKDGVWERWAPGYLVLTIERINGADIEPVVLDTANEEVTIAFAGWHDHCEAETPDEADDVIIGRAQKLMSQWLSNGLRTAVFSNAAGKWCGSALVEPGDVQVQLQQMAQGFRNLQPTQVQLRSLFKADWQSVEVDRAWLVAPKLSPDRLP